jgi:hypothetical protein
MFRGDACETDVGPCAGEGIDDTMRGDDAERKLSDLLELAARGERWRACGVENEGRGVLHPPSKAASRCQVECVAEACNEFRPMPPDVTRLRIRMRPPQSRP